MRTALKRLIVTLFLMMIIPDIPCLGLENSSPVISDLAVKPTRGGHGTKVKITLKIKDPQGDKDIDSLLYQVREGKEMIKISLYNDGTHGDEKANDNIYTGEMIVPGTAAERRHQFSVFIYDNEKNKSNILTYEFIVTGKEI